MGIAGSGYGQKPTSYTGTVGPVQTGMDPYGGYICAGDVTAVDRGGGRFEHNCSTGWIGASAYAAAYANLVHIELLKTNEHLRELATKVINSNDASKAALEKMALQMNEGIQEIVKKRFDTLPAELLNDPVVKARLEKLKEEITKDIKDSLSKPPTTPNP